MPAHAVVFAGNHQTRHGFSESLARLDRQFFQLPLVFGALGLALDLNQPQKLLKMLVVHGHIVAEGRGARDEGRGKRYERREMRLKRKIHFPSLVPILSSLMPRPFTLVPRP